MSMEYSVDYSDVIKAGVLERKGLVLGRWAKRFYILRDAFLFICRVEPTLLADGIAHPDHVIFLSGAAELRALPPTKHHAYVFSLVVAEPAREEHLLAAPSEEERAEWMECIADSIKMQQAETAEAEAAAATAAAAARASRSTSRTASRTASRAGSPSRSATSRLPKPLLRGNSVRNTAPASTSPPPIVPASVRMLGQTGTHSSQSPLHAAALNDGDAFADANGWLGTSPALPRQRVIPGAAAAAHAAAGRLDNNVALPAEPVSLHGVSSTRRQVAALSSLKDDHLRLDAFTLRTRSHIMEDALDDDANGGFGPLPEHDDDQDPDRMYDLDPEEQEEGEGMSPRSNAAFSPRYQEHDTDAYDSGADARSPTPRAGGGHSRVNSSSSFSATGVTVTGAAAATSPRSASSSRFGGGGGGGGYSSPSPSPCPPLSVSAVDDDTRLKLAQIEAGNNDPELLALQRETQLVDDKIQKLRLHKKVLNNEIKSLVPKLAIQAKVNRSYGEEIQLYKALASKRAAHRIQVSKWALGIKARLARSEPVAILKAQRREQAMQMQQMQQQQQQQQQRYPQAFMHHASSPYSPSSPAQPSWQALSPAGSGSSPIGGSSIHGGGSSGVNGQLAHSELIRLSNLELDGIEREVRMRRPAEGPAPDLLTSLQREEAFFDDADAHHATGIEQLDEWSRQRQGQGQRQRGNSNASSLDYQTQVQIRPRGPSNAGLGPLPPLTVPNTADSYALLLRAHTASLNNLTHLVVSILLREVDIRRQLNLLQDSIFKLTSEKEISFRNAHALLAAAGPVTSKQARAAAKLRNKK